MDKVSYNQIDRTVKNQYPRGGFVAEKMKLRIELHKICGKYYSHKRLAPKGVRGDLCKNPFLPNPPEADKFLRLPREM